MADAKPEAIAKPRILRTHFSVNSLCLGIAVHDVRCRNAFELSFQYA